MNTQPHDPADRPERETEPYLYVSGLAPVLACLAAVAVLLVAVAVLAGMALRALPPEPAPEAAPVCADVADVAPAPGLDYRDGTWWIGTLIVGRAAAEDEPATICAPAGTPAAEVIGGR